MKFEKKNCLTIFIVLPEHAIKRKYQCPESEKCAISTPHKYSILYICCFRIIDIVVIEFVYLSICLVAR